MKIAIGGSRTLPRGQAPRLLIRLLAALPEDTVVLLRSGMWADAGNFEKEVANLCGVLQLTVEWCKPKPDLQTPGRVTVYKRDIEMIDHADLVILFITTEEARDGYSGTYHLLEKAIDAARPVHAYTVDEDGKVGRLGDYDPLHLYDHLAIAI